jgi:hypothetical protein
MKKSTQEQLDNICRIGFFHNSEKVLELWGRFMIVHGDKRLYIYFNVDSEEKPRYVYLFKYDETDKEPHMTFTANDGYFFIIRMMLKEARIATKWKFDIREKSIIHEMRKKCEYYHTIRRLL